MTNHTRAARVKREKLFDNEIAAFMPNFFESGLDSSLYVEFLRKNEDSCEFFDSLMVKIIRKAFDSNELWVIEAIAGLFVVSVSAGLISKNVISRAFEKFFHLIDDLAVDVPGIYDTVVELICTGIDDNVLPVDFLSRTPITVLNSLINPQRQAAMSETINAMKSFRAKCKAFLTSPTSDFWNLTIDDAQEEVSIFFQKSHPAEYEFKHEFIRPLIVTSMTKNNTCREMVSQLLANCTGSSPSCLFSNEDVVLGFCRILLHLADTKLDIPNAQPYLAKFIARANIDEVIPPNFLRWTQRLHIGGEEGIQVLRLVEDWIDPETRKNLAVKYENIWRGSDPLSEVAIECRKVTRSAVNALYDNDDYTINETVIQIQHNALTPDLATVCVRVIVESILERDLEGRIVAIAIALLKKLKEEHEIDGSNVRDALVYLNSPERKAELIKDVGEIAVQHLGNIEQVLSEAGLDLD